MSTHTQPVSPSAASAPAVAAKKLPIVESRKDLVIALDAGLETTIPRSEIVDDDPNKPVGLGDFVYVWASPTAVPASPPQTYHAKPEGQEAQPAAPAPGA